MHGVRTHTNTHTHMLHTGGPIDFTPVILFGMYLASLVCWTLGEFHSVPTTVMIDLYCWCVHRVDLRHA